MYRLTQQTLEMMNLLKNEPLRKAAADITTGLGLVYYSLESAAKLLYPVLTPLRNTMPRFQNPGGFGKAENWRIITAINTGGTNIGVSEGQRGGSISYSEADKTAVYKMIGLESSVSFEAELAAQGFDDLRALAQLTALQALMIGEEGYILNGNTSLALNGGNATPTPNVVGTTGDGSLANVAHYVYCVALTQQAMENPNNSLTYNSGAGNLQPTIQRTNVDGTTDTFGGGIAKISAVGTATPGASGTLKCNVTAVKGAAGYAWFVGTTTGVANCKLCGFSKTNGSPTNPAIIISALPSTTYLANGTGLSSDNSTNALAFDGLIAQALSSTGYWVSLNNAKLTSDGANGIVELDTALQYWWDNYRISPTDIWVGSGMMKSIYFKVLAGTNPSYRVNLMQSAESLGSVIAGGVVAEYLNKFALGGVVPIRVRLHPNMPENQIFFDKTDIPYPNANVPTARRIKTRRDYYSIPWPIVTRQYPFGVYSDEVLQVYAPFGMGLIQDVQVG